MAGLRSNIAAHVRLVSKAGLCRNVSSGKGSASVLFYGGEEGLFQRGEPFEFPSCLPCHPFDASLYLAHAASKT